MKLNELTIAEAGRKLRTKEIGVRELWDACAAAAKEKNGELNAYLEIFPRDDAAIEAAQKRIDAGDAPPLCGIPLAIKDNILIEGKIASAASKMLENYRASYDATIIRKLKEAGALFLGRTNMDEFAMGSSTEHSAYGAVKNPLDPARTPGGSSGGSAAAVAAHMALGALGSDTGGSIRQPAAHTGLAGLKPTYGAVSRAGLIALGSSLDQIGPLAKSVEDARLIHEAIAGHDPMDSTTLPEGLYKNEKVSGKFRVGVPRHLLKEGIEPDVLAAFDATMEKLRAAGHEVVEVELPTSPYALAAYYVVMPAEASTNLARLDGIRYGRAARGATLLEDYVKSRTEGFGAETIRRILLGTFVLSAGYIDAYYRKAQGARELLRREYDAAFAACDVVAFPTTPAPAFKAGEKSGDPVVMYLEDIFTVTADLTGMPAISVPMGQVEREGKALPVGIHFTAPMQAEERLFTIGQAVEKAR
ncbi:MAG TPA: Asp-tRNA(Asn)/Glu-tRNA(Gln) amidotransferase subunit GatA [Candidatus Paceibacterota bacterium]|nr:Asp-tRNA(Asn)/Glu-tRNA(Gln) amidotransferase subunit GatA [Candidatus Paceibacterota bacterium]